MFGLGPLELIIILVVVLIIFGAGKLPQVGEALGRGIRNFKRASDGTDNPPSLEVTPAKTLPPPSSEANPSP